MKPRANCDFPDSTQASEDCKDETCFYFQSDRCAFLDSDTQLWLSENEGDM